MHSTKYLAFRLNKYLVNKNVRMNLGKCLLITQKKFRKTRVNDELSKIMTRAFTSVKDRVQAEGVTYREAAFLIGLERVAHVAELRGFI